MAQKGIQGELEEFIQALKEPTVREPASKRQEKQKLEV
jgi:hypothetical protein